MQRMLTLGTAVLSMVILAALVAFFAVNIPATSAAPVFQDETPTTEAEEEATEEPTEDAGAEPTEEPTEAVEEEPTEAVAEPTEAVAEPTEAAEETQPTAAVAPTVAPTAPQELPETSGTERSPISLAIIAFVLMIVAGFMIWRTRTQQQR